MKSTLSVVYADYSEITVATGTHLTELTWVVEDTDSSTLVPHHYFVDYPGIKDTERAITAAIGGTPLTRYSCGIVIRTFLSNLPKRSVVAFRTTEAKEGFKKYLKEVSGPEISGVRTLCTFDDVTIDESEAAFIEDILIDTKQLAAKKFGNAL